MGLIEFSGRHQELLNSSAVQRLVIIDASGIESDRIDVTVFADGLGGTPARDEKIQASWVLDSGKLDLGQYVISRVQFSGPPLVAVITASKAPYTLKNETEFDKRRSRSFEKKLLGQLVREVAGAHGFEVRVDPELANEKIDYVDQNNESDPAFLMRLARLRDAVAKPIIGDSPVYVFCKRGREKSFSGKSLASVVLPFDQKIKRFSYDEPGRSGLSGVEVLYIDPMSQQEKTLQVGRAPLKRFAHKFQDESQARNFAEAQLETLSRMQKTAMISLYLRPELFAEGRVELQEDWPEALRGLWIVNRLTHDIVGLRTDLVLNFLD